MSTAVTKLLVIRKKLMIRAAVVSSLPVLRIRPVGCSESAPSSPRTSGIKLTPVSKPESPKASCGNTKSATPSIASGLPWLENSALCQLVRLCGCVVISYRPTATTTRFKRRKAATKNTAMPIASLKPLRKTAPKSTSSTRVMTTSRPSKNSDTNGFSTMWAVASAEERVIVTTQAVATNPNKQSTDSLAVQKASNLSSIAIEP